MKKFDYTNSEDVFSCLGELVSRLSPVSGVEYVLDSNKELVLDVIEEIKEENANVKHRYYRDNEKRLGFLNPLFSDHLTKLLHQVSFKIWHLQKNQHFCDALFFILKSNCHINLFYQTEIPKFFFPFHALGSVLGRTKYGKYFFINQNCTVGGNLKEFPVFGEGVILGPNVTILGKCMIGDNVKIGAGSLIIEKNIPDNSVFIGRPEKYVIRDNKEDNRTIWLDGF